MGKTYELTIRSNKNPECEHECCEDRTRFLYLRKGVYPEFNYMFEEKQRVLLDGICFSVYVLFLDDDEDDIMTIHLNEEEIKLLKKRDGEKCEMRPFADHAIYMAWADEIDLVVRPYEIFDEIDEDDSFFGIDYQNL